MMRVICLSKGFGDVGVIIFREIVLLKVFRSKVIIVELNLEFEYFIMLLLNI